MTSININFDDAVEPVIAPQGSYTLQITAAQLAETGPNSKRPGSPMLKINIGFPDDVEYQSFNHFIMLPNEDDDKKQLNNKVLGLKRFLTLFNVPFSNGELDIEGLAMDMVGSTARAEVKQTEPNAEGVQYNSLVVPRIQDDRRY